MCVVTPIEARKRALEIGPSAFATFTNPLVRFWSYQNIAGAGKDKMKKFVSV